MRVIRSFALLTVALFALGAVSTASAQTPEVGIFNPYQSTPTTMYFHFDGRQDMPINTQPPKADYSRTESGGLVTNTATCVPDTGGAVPPLIAGDHHTYYGYSSPGYMEYDDLTDGGLPRHHPERGISFDVELDQSVQPVFTWYLESQVTSASSGGADPNTIVPTVLPNVVVQATIRVGDAISKSHEEMNRGDIIAQGRSTATNLMGQSTQSEDGTAAYMGKSPENGRDFYKFEFPLEYDTARIIPADEGYNVRVDIFMEDPLGLCTGPDYDDPSTIMLDQVRLYSGQGGRPQYNWAVMNPLKIEYLHPQFVGDDLVVHTSSNSPWGNYDVAEPDGTYGLAGGMVLTIDGPSLPITFDRVAFVQRYHDHNHHTEAVDATWLWEYKTDKAKEGDYYVTLVIKNDQESAEAKAVSLFNIGDGTIQGCGDATDGSAGCIKEIQEDGATAVKDSPGVGFVAMIGALAAAGIALRRRK